MRAFCRVLAVMACLSLVAVGQQEYVQPGRNLLVEGVPAIPQTLAREVDRYTEFRSAGFDSWHPVKREMLIRTRFADTNQIHQVKMPGGARQQLTFFEDKVGPAQYPPKERGFFVFSKDVGGGEWYQNYRYDTASGAVTLLTDGKSRNSLGKWSTAGDRMAYTSTRRTGRDSDIYVIDPGEPGSDHLLAEVEGGGWFPADWSPDDSQILVVEYVSANETYLWLFDARSGERKLLTPKGGAEKVAYTGAQFSQDGRGLYVTTDKDSEFQRLAFLDLVTGAHRFLSSDIQWDVEEFEVAPDGGRIAFATNENGLGVLYLLDTATGQYKKVPGVPAGVVSGVSWHENSRDLAFEVSSAHSPNDVYSFNTDTGKVERWTFSETAGLKAENFAEPELISWTSFDGKKITGFLYRPTRKQAGPVPVMISIHGGPEGQFRPSFRGSWNYYLNELGIAVIFPNVRGSSGFGKTFLKLDNGLKREDSYKDIAALLDWVGKQPGLDSKRVLVTGGSYGGFMTLAVATNYNDRICCSIDVVGISNMVTFLENTEDYRRDLRRAEYGDERDPKIRAFLESIAPVNKAGTITKPIFIIQGANDPRVPLSESQQMVKTIRENRTPVWYVMAQDEGHGFAKKKNKDFQFYSEVLFVKKFLLGERATEPAAE